MGLQLTEWFSYDVHTNELEYRAGSLQVNTLWKSHSVKINKNNKKKRTRCFACDVGGVQNARREMYERMCVRWVDE